MRWQRIAARGWPIAAWRRIGRGLPLIRTMEPVWGGAVNGGLTFAVELTTLAIVETVVLSSQLLIGVDALRAVPAKPGTPVVAPLAVIPRRSAMAGTAVKTRAVVETGATIESGSTIKPRATGLLPAPFTKGVVLAKL